MDIIIVPSPYTRAIAEKHFPQKKIIYIPIPFENKYIPSEDYVEGDLLYVGTIEPRKGLMYLVEAMSIFEKNSHLKLNLNVIGQVVDVKYKELVDSFIRDKGLHVNFLGRVSEKQLDACFRKAEVFTLPSLLEGYGIVLIEAMQRGLPIVCFNNSAMPYTIKDGVNGYLANNKDSYDFAMKLLKICSCKDNRHVIQNGIKETMAKIKTQSDFEKGIKTFWDNIDDRI